MPNEIQRSWSQLPEQHPALAAIGLVKGVRALYFDDHKFAPGFALKELLLSTGDAVLVERTWRDAFWGDGGNGKGKNMLGRVLMEVRSELKRDAKSSET